jgi:hypothetical protein
MTKENTPPSPELQADREKIRENAYYYTRRIRKPLILGGLGLGLVAGTAIGVYDHIFDGEVAQKNAAAVAAEEDPRAAVDRATQNLADVERKMDATCVAFLRPLVSGWVSEEKEDAIVHQAIDSADKPCGDRYSIFDTVRVYKDARQNVTSSQFHLKEVSSKTARLQDDADTITEPQTGAVYGTALGGAAGLLLVGAVAYLEFGDLRQRLSIAEDAERRRQQ